jgi:hypothetical protein
MYLLFPKNHGINMVQKETSFIPKWPALWLRVQLLFVQLLISTAVNTIPNIKLQLDIGLERKQFYPFRYIKEKQEKQEWNNIVRKMQIRDRETSDAEIVSIMENNFQVLFDKEGNPTNYRIVDSEKSNIFAAVITGAPGLEYNCKYININIGIGKSTQGLRTSSILQRSKSKLQDYYPDYINLNYYVSVAPTRFDYLLNNASVSLGLRIIYMVEFANLASENGTVLF